MNNISLAKKRINELNKFEKSNEDSINELIKLKDNTTDSKSITKINGLIEQYRNNISKSELEKKDLLNEIPVPTTINKAIKEINELKLSQELIKDRYYQ